MHVYKLRVLGHAKCRGGGAAGAVARGGVLGGGGAALPNFYKIAQFGNFVNPIRKIWRRAYFKKLIHLCPYNLTKFKEIVQSHCK